MLKVLNILVLGFLIANVLRSFDEEFGVYGQEVEDNG